MPSRELYQEPPSTAKHRQAPPITAKQCQSPPSTAKQYQSPSSTAAHRCALLNTAEAHVDHRPKRQCWLRPCRSLQASQSTTIAEYRVTFHSIRRPPRRQSRGAHHYLAQRPWCCLQFRHCSPGVHKHAACAVQSEAQRPVPSPCTYLEEGGDVVLVDETVLGWRHAWNEGRTGRYSCNVLKLVQHKCGRGSSASRTVQEV